MLDISNNRITDFSERSFSTLKQLEILNVSNNLVEDLPSNLFLELKELRILDISNNKLKKLDNELLKNLVKLNRLNFSNNSIEVLSKNIFIHNKRLKIINGFNNNIDFEIDEVGQTIFLDLKTFPLLKYLNLSSNKIKNFKMNSSENDQNSKLEYLNLNFNEIEYFDTGFLESYSKLEELKLKGNKLDDSFDTEHHIVQSSIKKLDLTKNQFSQKKIVEMTKKFGDIQLSIEPVSVNSIGYIEPIKKENLIIIFR
jgi:Leucine-rich repeat (LRR) protein